MKGLWLEDNRLQMRRGSSVTDTGTRGEALVRVLRAGICNTDIELLKNYYPFTGILGHEFVGIVEAGSEDYASSESGR